MRLKSFYAKTMTEAMQMVRETLGEDAVIVATREERGGKSFCVTAAIEPPAFELGHGGGRAAEPDEWLQYDSEEDEAPIAEEITEVMLRHNVPEEIMDQILSCVTVVGLENPGIALIAAIEHLYHFRPIPKKPYKKPMMLVGPPGSGKTLAAAKIAARGAMDGLKVGVITTDTVRAGGVEQLQAFTNLLDIPLQQASDAADLKNVIHDVLTECDQVVIDTAGTNPFDKQSLKDLAKLISTEEIIPHLVLPAGTDAEESGEMARAFATVGTEMLIPSRIDIARRMGGLLAAAHIGNLGFADASNTPKVAEGLTALTPKTLSKLLMPGAYKDQTPRKRARSTGTRQ